jgi:hypothetical protein
LDALAVFEGSGNVTPIGTLAAYNDHLARFPNCVFSTLAAARIEALKK